MSASSGPPWVESPVFEIDLDRPLAERYDAVPASLRDEAGRVLAAVLEGLPETIEKGGLAEAAMTRTGGVFREEAETLAAALGAPWTSLVLANVAYDLTMASFGCSTAALATPAGPVLARNMDWWPEELLARASCHLRHVRGGTLAWSNLAWPGAIGAVTGLSARGFAIALNAVAGPEGIDPSGYPVLLYLRHVLEDAAGYDDAVERLTEEPLAAPALVTVVGTDNDQRVVVERSPSRSVCRRPEGDGPLFTTNDYRLLFRGETQHTGAAAGTLAPALMETTCSRYAALGDLLGSVAATEPIEDGRLLFSLTDQRIMQEITAQHAIMRPRDGTARLFIPRRFTGA